jgi:hypothetical protein
MHPKKSIFFLFFFSVLCHSQKENTNVPFYLGKEYYNLRDSVKEVKFMHSFYRKGLTDEEKWTFYLIRDTKYGPIKVFNSDGLLKFSNSSMPDTIYKVTNLRTVDEYQYCKNFNSKEIPKIKHKFYYPLGDDYLLNRVDFNFKGYVGGSKNRDLIEKLYGHTFDVKNRIKEVSEYFPSHLEDTIPSGKMVKEDIWLQIVNSYNEKDLVVKQKMIRGPKDDFDSSFELSYESIGFCEDIELRYSYDNQDRMTRLVFYGCGKIVLQEDYVYNKTQDYVEQVSYFMNGRLSGFVLPTKRFVKKFNQYGDVIETTYIPDYEGQSNPKMRPHYYTYEYDSHNNWIKCYMYLEGIKDGEPTMIGERQIEYYK